jgi:hypothetical protein
MPFQKILLPAAGVLLCALAYRHWGRSGVALALGAIVMWGLLHVSRLLGLMRRASYQSVRSVALSRPLGALQSPPG